MKNNKIKFFVGISFALVFSVSFFTTAFGQGTTTATTSTTMMITEFLPSVSGEAETLEEKKARLLLVQQVLKGLIPNSALYAITGQPETLVPAVTAQTAGGGTVVFTKNLKLGDTDTQVLLLQKALNKDTDTIIAASGPGSSGNETTYFGQKTKTAVVKFQNKYAKEILAPNGLTAGTGYFGASTRAMLNSLQKNNPGNTGIPATQTVPKEAVSGLGEKVKITSLFPATGKDGTPVTIYGTGFSKSANKIIAGGQTIYNAKSSNGTTLTFTFKSTLRFAENPNLSAASSTYAREHFKEYAKKSVPGMQYPVCVINDSGMSNCAFFILDL